MQEYRSGTRTPRRSEERGRIPIPLEPRVPGSFGRVGESIQLRQPRGALRKGRDSHAQAPRVLIPHPKRDVCGDLVARSTWSQAEGKMGRRYWQAAGLYRGAIAWNAGEAMKSIVSDTETAETLRRWAGSEAVVWMYHASHRRFAIRFSMRGVSAHLYLVAIGCEFWSGPFIWDNSQIRISSDSPGIVIEDVAARFSLRCSEFSLATGPLGEHDETFVGFLGS